MSQATSTETSLRQMDVREPGTDSAEGTPLPAAPAASSVATGSDVRKSALLDMAYQDYVERLEAGEQVDPDEFCARYPALHSSLRSLLRAHSYLRDVPDDDIARFKKQQWPPLGCTFLGFRLQRELGQGAFARVYLADEPALGHRKVAVKVSCHGKTEARTLGKLAHPNIVPVHSIKEDADSDLTAVCMPYLGNATLSDVLDYAFMPGRERRRATVLLDSVASVTFTDDPVPARRSPAAVLRHGTYDEGVAYLGLKLARALGFVHAEGICHGDLKPSNVLISAEGEPLILDFNLALAEQVAGSRVGGTLPYMSPEQLRATDPAHGVDLANVDSRSDIFSLGVMLYELLSGKHPFGPVPLKLTAADLRVTLLERQQQGPISLAHSCPGVDSELARLVERCLAYDSAQRPQSAAEVEAELRQFLAPVPRLRRWAAPHKKALIAGACAVLGLAAVASYDLAPSGTLGERQFRQGNSQFRQGDYRAAIEHYTAALLNDAKYADARFARARAYLAAGFVNEAVTDFKILNEDAKNSDGRYLAGLGYAYLLQEHAVAALDPLRRATEKGYATAAVLNNLARSLLQAGLPEKDFDYAAAIPVAQQYLTQALALDPKLQAAYINRAMAVCNQCCQNPRASAKEGIEAADMALKIGPASGDLHLLAAKLCLIAAQADEKSWLERAFGHIQSALALGADPAVVAEEGHLSELKANARFQALVAQPRQADAGVALTLIVNPLSDDPAR